MFCSKCGCAIQNKDRFCSNCGQILWAEDGAFSDESVPNHEPKNSPAIKNDDELTGIAAEAFQILKKSIVDNPSVNLLEGETCFFTGEAKAGIAHTMNIGSVSSGGSIGGYFRPKGSRTSISARSYSSTRQNVRGTVVDQYEGHFYLTSCRMILVAYKGGFEINLDKITALEFYDDGFLVATGGKSYFVYLGAVGDLKRIIQANNVYMMAKKGLKIPGDISLSEATAKENGIQASSVQKKHVGLWIWLIICFFLTLYSAKNLQLKGFVFFVLLSIGFALHIDPAGLRDKGKLPPLWVTWGVCIVLLMVLVLFLF